MNGSKGLITSLLIITSLGVVYPAHIIEQEVIARSWQKGTDTVPEKKISIRLTPKKREYITRVISTEGKQYQLRVIYCPLDSLKRDHWKVELRQLIPRGNSKSLLLGANVLESLPGPGRDYFPREDYLAYIYPENENDLRIIVDGQQLINGYPLYPINAIRKIRVENFFVIIEVHKYQLNERDMNRVDCLNLNIEFQPA
jgi:hypothetical protein